ncbi:MAG: hypothetical protein R2769_09435 [Saprospiraceae bacterium]
MENKISNNKYFGLQLIQSPELEDLSERFMGNGKKGCLIILEKVDSQNNNHPFLKKVLQSVDLNTDEDCFIWEKEPDESILLGPVLRNYKATTLISFGVDTQSLGFNFSLQKYQIAPLESGKILMADDLTKIEQDKNLKMMLWNSLKALFEK